MRHPSRPSVCLPLPVKLSDRLALFFRTRHWASPRDHVPSEDDPNIGSAVDRIVELDVGSTPDLPAHRNRLVSVSFPEEDSGSGNVERRRIGQADDANSTDTDLVSDLPRQTPDTIPVRQFHSDRTKLRRLGSLRGTADRLLIVSQWLGLGPRLERLDVRHGGKRRNSGSWRGRDRNHSGMM